MAEASIIPLVDWPNGVVLPKGSHLQEPVTALRALSDAVGFDRRHPRRPVLTDWRLAMIVSSGPNGEADYTDERYWVALQAISDSDPTSKLQTEDDFQDGYTASNGSPTNIITASNLTELGDGSHFMENGQLVWVRGKLDLGTPQAAHWAFDRQPRRPISVHLSVDGGSNATTNIGYATYTYTLLHPDTGVALPGATGISPAGNRTQGYLTGPATIGMARFYSRSGVWTLISCDEQPSLDPNCPGV